LPEELGRTEPELELGYCELENISEELGDTELDSGTIPPSVTVILKKPSEVALPLTPVTKMKYSRSSYAGKDISVLGEHTLS